MHSHDRSSQRLAVGLAALAGFVDALGFLSLGGFFVSFMSGNSTRFAVDITSGAPLYIMLMPLGIILLFVAGVMAGKFIRHYCSRYPSSSLLFFISAALLLAALLHMSGASDLGTILLMVLSMGASNNVFVKDGEVAIGVTYMTGTLVKLGQRLAGAILKEPGSIWLPYLLLWLGLITGAVLGAVCFSRLNLDSLWVATFFCGVLAFLARRRDRHNARRA